MEKLYRKIGKKYVSVGYDVTDLPDGIWMVQSNPMSKRISSLVWKVGELKRPVDVVTHAAIHSMEDGLIQYIEKLRDPESPEFIAAREQTGLSEPIGLYNISGSDFATLLLGQIARMVEQSRDRSTGRSRDMLSLLNYEGDVLGIERTGHTFKLLYHPRSSAETVITKFSAAEAVDFYYGKIKVDHAGKCYNMSEHHDDAKPSAQKLLEFVFK